VLKKVQKVRGEKKRERLKHDMLTFLVVDVRTSPLSWGLSLFVCLDNILLDHVSEISVYIKVTHIQCTLINSMAAV
jgi:hypothetical protein